MSSDYDKFFSEENGEGNQEKEYNDKQRRKSEICMKKESENVGDFLIFQLCNRPHNKKGLSSIERKGKDGMTRIMTTVWLVSSMKRPFISV